MHPLRLSKKSVKSTYIRYSRIGIILCRVFKYGTVIFAFDNNGKIGSTHYLGVGANYIAFFNYYIGKLCTLVYFGILKDYAVFKLSTLSDFYKSGQNTVFNASFYAAAVRNNGVFYFCLAIVISRRRIL